MFDIDWTDYDAVSVGDHRKRKEQEREAKRMEDARSGHTTISTGSISSSEKSAGFFGSMSLRKGGSSSSKQKKPVLPNLQIIKDNDGKYKRDSAFLPQISTTSTLPFTISSATSDEKNMTCSTGDGGYGRGPMGPCSGGSGDRSSRESMFSKLTEITTPASASPVCDSMANAVCNTATIVQSLGPHSQVTRTTRMTSEPRTQKGTGDNRSAVVIYADHPEAYSPVSPASPPVPFSPTSPGSPQRDFLHPLPSQDGPASGRYPLLTSTRYPRVAAITPTRAVRKKSSVVGSPGWNAKLKTGDLESWKAPDDWNRCPMVDKTSAATERLRQAAEDEEAKAGSSAMDLTAIQREVKKMAAASYKIMLVRLTEEWGNAPEASFYQELEMERKRWVLAALHRLGGQPDDEARKTRKEVPKTQKMLALFESKATASWLAALHPEASITHLAPNPLSDRLFPNVQPLFSPVVSTAPLSLAPASFTSVHCLAMPSTIAGKDIPLLLQNINRCLVPGGVLYLLLIDPEPETTTMGTKMRAWFDENLVLNLEHNFRCRHPSKLFPKWLGDARLRASGSLISKGKFWAAGSPSRPEPNTSQDSIEAESSVKNELRNTMGRMLWQEIWGSFVNGSAWWWQDQECLDECSRLGTFWEYSVIEAVKGDNL